MKQKLWIAGGIFLVFLLILCIYGSNLAVQALKSKPGSVGQRDPLPAFGYCSLQGLRPCVLSFNLDEKGGMVINILTDSLQDFYIKIRHAETEYIYACKRARQYSIHVACGGEALPVGETLNFLVLSSGENTTLAQGSFSIIGMALATPEIRITPTPYIPGGPR